MIKVYAQDLVPGMMVGREVVSVEGVVLLDRGTRLTQSHIAILHRRCVPFVFIAEEEIRQ